MTAQEFVNFLDRYIADKTPNFGDGNSVLTLLYEAYNDANNMDNDEIKAGFHELYQTINGMPLREMDTIVNPVCTLCRDYEQAGFVHGVQVGMLLARELKKHMPEQKAHRTQYATRSTGFFIYNARFTRHGDELFQSRLHFRFCGGGGFSYA